MLRQIARAHISISRSLLLMAAVTVCVVLLSGAVDYLEERLNVHHAEYFIYVALILLGVYVIRKYLTEYRYSLFDDEVIVDRIIGSRSAPMLVLRMREIEEQGRLDELSEDRRQYVQRVVRANVRRAGCGYILFRRDEALQMLVYNPTDEFTVYLAKALALWRARTDSRSGDAGKPSENSSPES